MRSSINNAVDYSFDTNVKMKNSGIEWIGKVPEHWEACRFKDFIKLCTKKSDSINKIGLENIESGTGRFIETDTEFEGNGVEFKKGDIVYGKLRPYLQKVWMAEFSGNAVGDFFVFNARKNAMPAYIKYVMLSDGFTKVADGSTAGAKMPRVSSDFILSLHYYIPSLKTQQRIITYLDNKLSEISHQVSLLTSKRDAYLRLKKSIINHAVTHGLNPNVKMKDSGIEWIGEVPEHWEVKRMKDICDYISRGTTPDYVDEGYQKVMNQATFSKGWIDERNIRYTKVGNNSAHIKNGDLLMASTGGGVLGKILYFDCNDENFYADSHVTIMRNSKEINSMKFLFYYFSQRFEEINATMTKGSTNQTELQRNELLSHKVALPPLPEQHAIATYLDDKCAKIDSIVSNLDKQVSRYGDLKRALIDEVITGKRAV